jgi:hypothetical protein
MVVRFKFSAAKQTKLHDYLARFGLGGLTAVVAGLVGDLGGPALGGLFLAFPAIFAASATLIEKHERQRKERKCLSGVERGKGAAALDAAGAGWGSLGLGGFAVVLWQADRLSPLVCLATALLVWLAIAIAAWRLRRDLRARPSARQRHGPHPDPINPRTGRHPTD